MIFKNTSANRRLVKKLSDYICDASPYFRSMIDREWNCSADLRFEIASVGMDNPVLVDTFYTKDDGFSFRVRLLKAELSNQHDLIRTTFRLADAEKIILNIQAMIENAHPEASTYDC